MQAPPELIIFDCDGVLVDSEPISMSVLTALIKDGGGTISEETAYLRFLGRSMASIGDILHSEFGLSLSQRHHDHMRSEVARRFELELKPMPGVVDMLPRLAAARCVASSSGLERIRLSLRLTGLLELLEPHIYSASMVRRGKPDPDLFLHAAREMGVRPAHCLVIEDSPAGVSAARRAGMAVFAFTGGSHAASAALDRELAGLQPDAVFDDMAALPDLIDRVVGREKAAG